MNFSPAVKAWIQLITLVLSTGIATGYAAFLTGASWKGATIVGIGTAASNVYHALSASPKDKADAAASAAPFPAPRNSP